MTDVVQCGFNDFQAIYAVKTLSNLTISEIYCRQVKKTLKLNAEFHVLLLQPYLDPPVKAREAMIKNGLPVEDFFTLKHGETKQIGGQ